MQNLKPKEGDTVIFSDGSHLKQSAKHIKRVIRGATEYIYQQADISKATSGLTALLTTIGMMIVTKIHRNFDSKQLCMKKIFCLSHLLL